MSGGRSMWFLILVFVQVAHSVEEYLGDLWDVFPPAVWLTSVVSDDRHLGFLIINIGLFVVGFLLWALVVRVDKKPVNFIIWFWIILELINGIGHTAWAVYRMSYEPGLITAPLLVIVAFILLRSQLKLKI